MSKISEVIGELLKDAIGCFFMFGLLGGLFTWYRHMGDAWDAILLRAVALGIFGTVIFLIIRAIIFIFRHYFGIRTTSDIKGVVIVAFFISFIWSAVAVYERLKTGKQLYSSVTEFELLFLLPTAMAIELGLIAWRRPEPEKECMLEPVGTVTESQRGGLPALAWSQLVATNETVASQDANGRFNLWVGGIVIASVLGLLWGGWENMLMVGLVSAWLGAFGLGGAGTLQMAGQSLQAVPYAKTEGDRREERTPVAKREDCEAFLEVDDKGIWFCVARGDKTKGALPIVERVPWDSFGNFEEGSHRQWFRPRASMSELADWGVIIAQSSVGRVALVAESLHEQAWLIELLVRLQNTFVGPRESMLQAVRDAAAEKRGGSSDEKAASLSTDASDVPAKSF
jgi:hypothetical protein